MRFGRLVLASILALGLSARLAAATTQVSSHPAGRRPGGLFTVRAWPDSTRVGASILWTLARPAIVRVGIFDPSGRLLWNLRPEERVPGIYATRWDAHDALGHLVPPGTYSCRVESVDDFAGTDVIVAP